MGNKLINNTIIFQISDSFEFLANKYTLEFKDVQSSDNIIE
jgi:hypothetical protein